MIQVLTTFAFFCRDGRGEGKASHHLISTTKASKKAQHKSHKKSLFHLQSPTPFWLYKLAKIELFPLSQVVATQETEGGKSSRKSQEYFACICCFFGPAHMCETVWSICVACRRIKNFGDVNENLFLYTHYYKLHVLQTTIEEKEGKMWNASYLVLKKREKEKYTPRKVQISDLRRFPHLFALDMFSI